MISKYRIAGPHLQVLRAKTEPTRCLSGGLRSPPFYLAACMLYVFSHTRGHARRRFGLPRCLSGTTVEHEETYSVSSFRCDLPLLFAYARTTAFRLTLGTDRWSRRSLLMEVDLTESHYCLFWRFSPVVFARKWQVFRWLFCFPTFAVRPLRT
ncbi:hypothetical protein L210DRAFT_536949 [Boletus edulis BED1]|uniref:Uncharacterized protein n=1 Tax=Boletus edulis BED1 TaxID=1328754 RepID=A0AAD4BJV4_BOLED|nr:hypothetical protein L210DRAFT_536949 [Boletus edulis BED1]